MSVPKTITAVIALLVAFLMPAQAFEPSAASYSATRVIDTKEGSVSMQIFHRPDMERVEVETDGGNVTTLVRWDRSQAIQLIPGVNGYMEIPLDRSQVHGPEDVELIEREKLGTEVVNGHQATKYRAVYASPDGGRGEGMFWFTADNIPIKMDARVEHGGRSDRVRMELKGLKIGTQPDHLFEIPPGYKPLPAAGGSR